ncbi:hypothetical protein JOL79_25135 [Microbispora sp. RL4-1S]|uniref:Chitinase n=1 Tax=Microbispora oryzae TaxID=2806554 RepID=A0A940WJX8_9ACTN|nr:hypothetical protein [Microbispora oryzae]MBP2707074.1 hypothetical protein [Microbispora oryzae]
MDAARHARDPGNPPGFLVLVAAVALVSATGLALWLLPAAPPGWAGAARPSPTGTLVAARQNMTPGPSGDPRPAGHRTTPVPLDQAARRRYVAFVEAEHLSGRLPGHPDGHLDGHLDGRPAARSAGPGPDDLRAPGPAAYTVGHLVAGPDGCSPRWSGLPRTSEPVTARVRRLGVPGRDITLAFGGPAGAEPAQTCRTGGRLAAAYRTAIEAVRPGGVDFEPRAPDATAVTLRRAAAIIAVQREARAAGRPFGLTFTLPATPYGLAPADTGMLGTTREAGADIRAVNLLVPFAPGSKDNLRRLAATARAAHRQLEDALGIGAAEAWRRLALTPVLATPADLDLAQARRLAAFAARNGLCWLSLRGADPAPGVVEALAAPVPTSVPAPAGG